jgi:hypothetical protein
MVYPGLQLRNYSLQVSVLTNTAPDFILKALYRLRKKFNIRKSTPYGRISKPLLIPAVILVNITSLWN